MRILFDIVHPADVHFFRHAIAAQRARGDEVLVTSRAKDITIPLLDRLDIPHQVLTRQGRGPAGLLAELLLRNGRLLTAARTFRPDILVGNNSPCVAHVGWLLRRPSLIFDDTEIHRFNRWLYYPFVTEVHSPRCYHHRLGRKHRLYPSYHVLAYLHPAHFSPSPWLLNPDGPEPRRKRVFLRFVHHGALHDVGGERLTLSAKRELVAALAAQAEVAISSEAILPADLERYRTQAPLEGVHQILAGSDLVVGESATMCAEAAVLGTPSIYIDHRSRGYADELQERYGLCFRFDPHRLAELLEKARAILAPERPRQAFESARSRVLADNLDAAAYQMAAIDRLVHERSR